MPATNYCYPETGSPVLRGLGNERRHGELRAANTEHERLKAAGMSAEKVRSCRPPWSATIQSDESPHKNISSSRARSGGLALASDNCEAGEPFASLVLEHPADDPPSVGHTSSTYADSPCIAASSPSSASAPTRTGVIRSITFSIT